MDNNVEVSFEELLEQMRNRIGIDAQTIAMKDSIIKKLVNEHAAVLKEKDLEKGELEREIDQVKEVVQELKEKNKTLQSQLNEIKDK